MTGSGMIAGKASSNCLPDQCDIIIGECMREFPAENEEKRTEIRTQR